MTERTSDITMPAAEARLKFRDILDQCRYRGWTFVITRHGKPVARLVPVEDKTEQELRRDLDRYLPEGMGRG